MTDMSPRVVIQFPKLKKADCQGERLPYSINLKEQIQRVKSGLGEGMTEADIQNEQDAQQGQEIIERWVRRLADNPRRGPSKTATFLCSLAGNLNGDEAS